MQRSKSRIIAAAACLVGVTLIASSCSADPLAAQYGAGGNKNYISGSGAVTEIPVDEREKPIDFVSTDESGKTLDASMYQGQVLVVNFWYAGCPPCRAEASDLETVYGEFESEEVEFLGVNTHDSAQTTKAFMSNLDVSYSSAIDSKDGAVQLAFAGKIAPNSTPSTMVLDRQGRVASRVLGQINMSVLRALIKDTIAEDDL